MRSPVDEHALVRFADVAASPSARGECIALIHAASLPYADAVYGGPERARAVLSAAFARESAEVAASRARVAVSRDGVVAGLTVVLDGRTLARCRLADTLAVLGAADPEERAVLKQRLAVTSSLWAPVEADALYLSKVAVTPRARRSGLGTRLLEDTLAAARAADLRAVVLDVAANNEPARSIYQRCGFRRISEHSAALDDCSLAYVRFRREVR